MSQTVHELRADSPLWVVVFHLTSLERKVGRHMVNLFPLYTLFLGRH
jgi:hypothetical protein